MVLPCFIWAWHWVLARTWINRLIPSLGEISTFLSKGKLQEVMQLRPLG